MDQHKYELIKSHYWVQDFCNGNGSNELSPLHWIFHPNGEPHPKTYVTSDVPRHWRKPTYEEVLDRQEWFSWKPQHKIDEDMKDYSKMNRQIFDNC